MTDGWEAAIDGFRDRQRAGILDAAVRLMADGEELTMSALAAAAGISRPTLYKYFPDADHVRAAVGATLIAGLEAQVAPELADAGSPADQLAHLARRVVSGVAVSPASAIGELPPDAAAVVLAELDRVRAHVVRALEDGRADGTFRADVDPEADSHLLLAMLGSVRSLAGRGLDPVELADRTAELVVAAVS